MTRGKITTDAYKQVDNTKVYTIKEAIELLVKNKINLGNSKNINGSWMQSMILNPLDKWLGVQFHCLMDR